MAFWLPICLSKAYVINGQKVIGIFLGKGKGKGSVHPRTGHEGPEGEERYSCTQRHTPVTSPLGKTQHPLYMSVVGPQGWSGQVQKISPLPGLNLQSIQAIASCYIDWAIPAQYVFDEFKQTRLDIMT